MLLVLIIRSRIIETEKHIIDLIEIFFCTSSEDECWNELKDKGYARCSSKSNNCVNFHLTQAGLRWLGKELNITIYDDLTPSILLCKLCELSLYETIYSVNFLSENYFNNPKSEILKNMKMLENEGYVRKKYSGDVNTDGKVCCYHGWSITNKTKELPMYKEV